MKNNSRKECVSSFFFVCVHFAVMNVTDCSFPPTTIHKPQTSQPINQSKKKKKKVKFGPL